MIQANELTERERLLELQKIKTRWFSEKEFNKLNELSNKMFVDSILPPLPRKITK
jgi:hypothetical protein